MLLIISRLIEAFLIFYFYINFQDQKPIPINLLIWYYQIKLGTMKPDLCSKFKLKFPKTVWMKLC